MSQNQAHNPAPLFKNKMGFLLSKEKIWTFCNICKKENKNSSGVKLCTNIQQQKQDSLQGDCWICSWLMEEPCPPGGHWDLDSPSQVVQGPRRTLFLSLAPGAFVYLLFTLDASARASTGVDCTNANQARRGEGGASGGEATLVFAPRRVGIQSGPSRSRRKVHRITSYVCFGLKQTSSTTFIPAPHKNPTNSSAPSCLLIDRSIFSFAPAGESREKRKKKKSTTPGETEREEEKARRKTQEVEAREEKVI